MNNKPYKVGTIFKLYDYIKTKEGKRHNYEYCIGLITNIDCEDNSISFLIIGASSASCRKDLLSRIDKDTFNKHDFDWFNIWLKDNEAIEILNY